MLEDDKAPTLEQRIQMQAGQSMALNAAVHALIRSHPNPQSFAAVFETLLEVTNPILVTGLALQANDGLREAYSETVRTLRSMLPQS